MDPERTASAESPMEEQLLLSSTTDALVPDVAVGSFPYGRGQLMAHENDLDTCEVSEAKLTRRHTRCRVKTKCRPGVRTYREGEGDLEESRISVEMFKMDFSGLSVCWREVSE